MSTFVRKPISIQCVPPEHRRALHDLIEAEGEREALKTIGLSRIAAYRILAGLAVQAGTRAIVREAFESRPPRAA